MNITDTVWGSVKLRHSVTHKTSGKLVTGIIIRKTKLYMVMRIVCDGGATWGRGNGVLDQAGCREYQICQRHIGTHRWGILTKEYAYIVKTKSDEIK